MNKRKVARYIVNKLGISHSAVYQLKFGDAFKQQQKLITKNNPVIFDVGAFDGRTAVAYIKKFSGAAIHSFEPFPASFAKLSAARVNNEHVLNDFALSDDNVQVPFYVSSAKTCNSMLPSSGFSVSINQGFENENVISIPTKKLDDYCAEKNIGLIDILKIDVQGAELKVLKGACEMLEQKKISLIYFETEFSPLYEGQPLFEDISLYLRDKGYVFFSFYNFNHLPNGRMVAADAIFVSNSANK